MSGLDHASESRESNRKCSVNLQSSSRAQRRETLFHRLTGEFGDSMIATVLFTSEIDFSLQCALWRKAKVVIGIHGGNLGCSAFLSPGQGLIEGSFECSQQVSQIDEPLSNLCLMSFVILQFPHKPLHCSILQSAAPMSMFGIAATSGGAMYRCALVDQCGPNGCMESGGVIDVEQAAAAVRDILAVEKVEELSTWVR